jgi:acyl carrier protein
MTATDIRELIISLFRERESFRDIAVDDDYFNLGVSSLTIVSLQIKVEERLGVSIATRDLMGLSTISEWIDAYTRKCGLTPTPALECA